MNSNPNEKPIESNQNTSYRPDPNWYNPYESNFPVPPPDPSRYPPYQAFPTPQPPPNSYAPSRAGAWIPASQPAPPSSPGMPPTVALPGTYGYGGPKPPSTPPPSSSRRTLLIALAALVILAGIGLAIFIPYQNVQTEKANATATAIDAGPTATAQANASATAAVIAANTNPYPPNNGTLVLYDPLTDNNQGNNWPDSVDLSGNGCTFQGGAYHVSAGEGYIQPCTINSYTNFAFEAQLQILKGDCGSLIFRDNNIGSYAFSVCQDGTYRLDFFRIIEQNTLLNSSSSAIKTGLNTTNVLAVVAQGSKIDLYVNSHHVGSVNDSGSSSGGIGFGSGFGSIGINGPSEVAFTNARAWTF